MPEPADAERCKRCKVKGRTRVPGLTMCAYCRELTRDSNKRRRHAKRLWDRANDPRCTHGRSAGEWEAERDAIHAAKLDKLRAWGEQHGVVPTLREVCAILGYVIRPTAGNGARSQPQLIRREAFNLKPARTGRRAIPYPVPKEYQND